jgi:uncharacterized protein (DUF433 family)
MVDILFTIPVINSKLSNEELLPAIYVDKNGDKHQFQKISPNSDQVIECVAYAHKKWKEKSPNKHRSIDDFSIEVHELLERHRAGTNVREIKAKIDAYLNVLDLFVMQGKKEKEKGDKYSNVNQRLYALKELCPELIDSLSKLTQAEQKELMQIITNSNGDNVLKKLVYKNSPMDVDSEFEDKIDRFKNKISKKKV